LAECSRLICRCIEMEYTGKLMHFHQLKYYSIGVTYYNCPNFLEDSLNKND